MLFEVLVVKVRVHVQPGQAEVESAGDVRDDALPSLADSRRSHPHVPVPQLQSTRFIVLFFVKLAQHKTG